MNRILIIYTGGTIGMVRSTRGYTPKTDYFRKALDSIAELHADTMPRWELVEMDPLLDSSNMTVRDMRPVRN